MNKSEELGGPNIETIQLGEIREFEQGDTRIVIHKDRSHSSVSFVGGPNLDKVEQVFREADMGSGSAKLQKPSRVIGGEGQYIEASDIRTVVANWATPNEFMEEVLGPFHEADLLDQEVLDAF